VIVGGERGGGQGGGGGGGRGRRGEELAAKENQMTGVLASIISLGSFLNANSNPQEFNVEQVHKDTNSYWTLEWIVKNGKDLTSANVSSLVYSLPNTSF
jgi:hypothetical protein